MKSYTPHTVFMVVCCALLAAQGRAIVDLDDNGLSDLWELYYDASDLEPDADSDGDGLSNRRESLIGSNPFSAEDGEVALVINESLGSLKIGWSSNPDRFYQLESSGDLEDWELEGAPVSGSGSWLEHALQNVEADQSVFARLSMDGDHDADGLSNVEEAWLGLDPGDPNSSSGFLGGDLAYCIALLAEGESFALGGKTVSGNLPTAADASRFLAQAALGASDEAIARVSEIGYDAWIDEQFEQPVGLLEAIADKHYQVNGQRSKAYHHYAWFERAMTSPDVLRQRIALAFSEIYVVSDATLAQRPANDGMANYYDVLLRNAFGNCRDLLMEVTMHPIMGTYLSHLKNRKANPSINRFPDENYAREIMQLFSIGLFQLNQDGTRRKDSEGEDIPTYDNDDITNLARVFTGFSYGGDRNDESNPAHFFRTGGNQVWDLPMKVWESEHDKGAKQFLNAPPLPAFTDDLDRTPMDDINTAIDILFEHPNVGPFISHLIIQRLVTSNPSPEYIRRVANVFEDNGNGERGDFKSVVKAILLDSEARGERVFNVNTRGRLREPFVRWVRIAKTFEASASSGEYFYYDNGVLNNLGQRRASSPTVFNFFLPNYSPNKEFESFGLVGPEFEILTATFAVGTPNYIGNAISSGFGLRETTNRRLYLNYDNEIALANNAEALIERINILLMYGRMTQETRTILRTAFYALPSQYDSQTKVESLLRLAVLSPEYTIFR